MADEPPKKESVLSWIRDTSGEGQAALEPEARQQDQAVKGESPEVAANKPVYRKAVLSEPEPPPDTPEPSQPEPPPKAEPEGPPVIKRGPGVIQYIVSLLALICVAVSPIPQRYVELICFGFLFVILAEISYRVGLQYYQTRTNEEKLDALLKALRKEDGSDPS